MNAYRAVDRAVLHITGEIAKAIRPETAALIADALNAPPPNDDGPCEEDGPWADGWEDRCGLTAIRRDAALSRELLEALQEFVRIDDEQDGGLCCMDGSELVEALNNAKTAIARFTAK